MCNILRAILFLIMSITLLLIQVVYVLMVEITMNLNIM